MSTRSMTPRTSCSEPIGISVATTCGPKAALSESSVRKKSARSRSSMFTKTRRATPSSCGALPQALRARPRRPSRALTHEDGRLADAQRAERVGDEATARPGVSIRLILRVAATRTRPARAEIDISRAFSSSSESETVVPSVTEPSRVIAPASNSRASCSDVFPLPRWPTRATLRIRSAALVHARLSSPRRAAPSLNAAWTHAERCERQSPAGCRPGGATSGAARPSCAAGRCATR